MPPVWPPPTRRPVPSPQGEPALSGDHIREGLGAVVSVKVPNPEFEGQTKTRLGNPEVKRVVEAAVLQVRGPRWTWCVTGCACIPRCSFDPPHCLRLGVSPGARASKCVSSSLPEACGVTGCVCIQVCNILARQTGLCSASSAVDPLLSKLPCGAARDGKRREGGGEGGALYQPRLLLQSTRTHHRITRDRL